MRRRLYKRNFPKAIVVFKAYIFKLLLSNSIQYYEKILMVSSWAVPQRKFHFNKLSKTQHHVNDFKAFLSIVFGIKSSYSKF